MGYRVCQVAAELTPFAKTGGLGDVVAGLSRALGKAGHDVRIFLPFYARIAKQDHRFVVVDFLRDLEMQLGSRRFTWSIFTAKLPDSDVDVYFVHCPALYHHDGIYSGDWDEYLRYALLTRAALECCQRMGWAPRDRPRPRLAHRPRAGLPALALRLGPAVRRHTHRADAAQPRLPGRLLHPDARRPRARAARAAALQGGPRRRPGQLPEDRPALRRRADHGQPHLRARDPDPRARLRARPAAARAAPTTWSASSTASTTESGTRSATRTCPHNYSARTLAGKGKMKRALLEKIGLPHSKQAPVLGIVSRLTAQKGLDLLFDTLPEFLFHRDVRFVALGSGEERYESFLSWLQVSLPGQGLVLPRLQRGAGALDRGRRRPLRHAVALRAVRPQPDVQPALRHAAGRARARAASPTRSSRGTRWRARAPASLSTTSRPKGCAGRSTPRCRRLRDPAAWEKLQQNGMAKDFSWERQVREYEELYRRLLR